MNLDAVLSAYRRYARYYDVIFGPIMHPGRRRVVEALNCAPGERLLEVGVGTGLSLPLYPAETRITGIDISADMLERARQRVERDELPQVESIEEMDAEAMTFADNTFDKVVAMYVISVVPDPRQVVAEMQRVCKPGGDIYIVNHFHSRNALLAGIERLLAPLSRLAGFRPDLDLDELVTESGLEVVDIRGTNLFGYWKILRCRNGVTSSDVAVEVKQETESLA